MGGRAKKEPGPFFHEVRSRRGPRPALPDILEQAASATEREAPARDFKTVNAASHLASAASKPAHELQLRRGQRQQLRPRPRSAPGDERTPERCSASSATPRAPSNSGLRGMTI